MIIQIKSLKVDKGNLIIEPVPTSKHLSYRIAEEMQKSDKVYVASIEPQKKKRSLDANGAMWQILSMMADVLHTTKDELYLEALDRYGVFTHVVVKKNIVERMKKEWKLTRELGEVTVNGNKGVQLQCYFGSSTYDSKEFSVLLNGVIEDAKELGIDFISREEQSRLIEEWGK